MDEITRRDPAEAIALFRLQVLGALTRRQLRRGELRAELRKLSQQRFLPPGEEVPRRFSVTTLERWYYALRKRSLPGLRPKQRDDRGRARALTEQQRHLLLDIRSEHPRASVPVILTTLVRDGRLAQGLVSQATIRRFYAQQGFDRTAAVRDVKSVRHRWQAESPCILRHADVCHGSSVRVGVMSKPLRIHAILDDASRYIVAISVSHTERESDMLALMVKAWRQWGISGRTLLDAHAAPWIEYADKQYPLCLMDPVANGRRKRRPQAKREMAGLDVPFDPTGVLLNAVGGKP